MDVATGSADLLRHLNKFYGKYSGEVVDDEDTEKRGAVKVKVPSVFGDQETVWARPCFPPGHFFVPPVGARVWVEFEAGETASPLWVGTWYPQNTVPPEADLQPPTSRVVHTPSGHVVELADKDGEEQLVIRHRLDSSITIDKEGSVLVANQNGSSLLLDSENAEATLTSEQGHTVTMGQQGVVVRHSGGAKVDVADGQVTVSGASKVQLAGASIDLGSRASSAVLLGDLFLPFFSTHFHASAMGPTGPATNIPPLVSTTVLSQVVKVQP